ncbi:response regulator [Pontibacter beigongshangensis]|uniref:response regulator n=1 Tax=Pontibacter beigongshangensis TaxID=2574733 RepID=UPI0016502D56|nr:response regulator [Pontibacter beigongshangensis]
MKFVANAFKLPVPVASFIRLSQAWFTQESAGHQSKAASLKYEQCHMDTNQLFPAQAGRIGATNGHQSNNGKVSFLGGSILNRIDSLPLAVLRSKEQTGTKSLLNRPTKKQSANAALLNGSVIADSEARQIYALLHETEKLAKTGSWEYEPLTKRFICSKNINRLLNIPHGQKIQHFHTLLPYLSVESRALVQESWNQILSQERKKMNHELQLTGIHESKWVRLNAKPVYDGTSVIKIIGIIQDITETKKHEAQLLADKAKAEQSNMVKSEFVSVLSHEVRTPLNAIMGLTHLLLQEESIVGKNKANLESIHFSSQNMLGLINNTLDYSRIEAGKIELEKVNFHLKDLLRDIHRSLLPKATEKQLKFDLSFDIKTPAVVAGDPSRLTQILNNLTSNAIKFTATGCVKLSVDVVYQSNNEWVLEFSVADTGMGIPEDRQHLIFESFTQANTAINRQYGGTGLGLTITKRLVELHKGSIKVKSSPGQGSEFSVFLRFVKPNPTLVTLKSNSTTESQNTGLKDTKILVIDDNSFNKMVAKQLLIKWQAEVDTADDGVDALEKVKEANYDLILMDLYMPIMDGFEAISELRQRGYQMPIVALTANASEEEKNKVLALGGNDYLTKPFIPQVLYNKLVQQINTVKMLS